MILKGIAATTKIDAHNTRIALEALVEAAESINTGESVPSVGVEHDPTIMPIGKMIKAHIEKLDDVDYGLYCEQDIFSVYSTVIDGETFIVQKSLIDDRPLTSATIEDHEKLLVQTDFVNFQTLEDAKLFFEEISSLYSIETGYIGRKSMLPDPELVFQLMEATVKGLFLYLSSKTVFEKIGNHVVDRTLSELDDLYRFIKKAIISASKRFIPANRPVTYVFTGKYDFLIELVVQTTNPNIAISAISEDRLVEVITEINRLRSRFSNFTKIQLVYNEDVEKWEFNYLATEKGEIIGTEKSYKKSTKKIELAFPGYQNRSEFPTSIAYSEPEE